MAASASDYFKKGARKFVGQIGSGGVADDSVTTIPLASSTGLPTDTGVEVVIDRVDSNGTATPTTEETVVGVVSGNNLVTCTRGVEGTAQAHSAGAVVECLFTADNWNDLIDGLLVDHAQDGTHNSLDINGTEFTIDEDGDSSLTADTDDQLDVKLGNSDRFRFKTSDFDIVTATGNVTVAGADPWRTITLMPGLLKPATTSGCAAQATVEAGTNDIDYDVLDFDKDTDEIAFANFQMPDSWDAGVVQFRYVWTTAAGGAAETVQFELSGISFANDDAIDTAVGTPVAVSDTWIADGDVHISSWSGDVTLAGTPAAGELVHLEILRDVSDDNLGGDARLIAVQIRYKQAQYTD